MTGRVPNTINTSTTRRSVVCNLRDDWRVPREAARSARCGWAGCSEAPPPCAWRRPNVFTHTIRWVVGLSEVRADKREKAARRYKRDVARELDGWCQPRKNDAAFGRQHPPLQPPIPPPPTLTDFPPSSPPPNHQGDGKLALSGQD
ncbi:hypothetical protein BaRGS_00005710 [Batillaria attramentaria]|uniref:Uncharacterized protein n=1 Tax=Batillaria attramentaria TaxID=370345 RepID=A0ABD0LU24_9CAEN